MKDLFFIETTTGSRRERPVESPLFQDSEDSLALENISLSEKAMDAGRRRLQRNTLQQMLDFAGGRAFASLNHQKRSLGGPTAFEEALEGNHWLYPEVRDTSFCTKAVIPC